MVICCLGRMDLDSWDDACNLFYKICRGDLAAFIGWALDFLDLGSLKPLVFLDFLSEVLFRGNSGASQPTMLRPNRFLMGKWHTQQERQVNPMHPCICLICKDDLLATSAVWITVSASGFASKQLRFRLVNHCYPHMIQLFFSYMFLLFSCFLSIYAFTFNTLFRILGTSQ